MSSIWFVESLRENDTKTGRKLYEDVFDQAQIIQPGLVVHWREPLSKTEFFEVLREIAGEARAGHSPILHLECHGDQEGIELSNGDLVDWWEISQDLIVINEACGMNFVVILAACKGAYLIHAAENLDRAPFFATIGPREIVYPSDILPRFGEYYSIFLKELNGDKAVDALNRGAPIQERMYRFATAEALFKRAFAMYVRKYKMGRGKQQRMERLVTLIRQDSMQARRPIAEVRRDIKDFLQNDAQYFERRRSKFFFIDLYPENEGRFVTTFSDVEEMAKTFDA